MLPTKISELIVKRFFWKEKQPGAASLYCIQIIAIYKSGRTADNTYHTMEEVPYPFRDYMKIDNLRETKEIQQPGSLLFIRMLTYKEV